jgi:hypothetical protein
MDVCAGQKEVVNAKGAGDRVEQQTQGRVPDTPQ